MDLPAGTGADLIIKTVTTWERSVIIKQDKVIKRELRDGELTRRRNGDLLRPLWAKERLQNEAATIQFIASKTSIPVPKCRLYTKDGLLHLEMERITNGTPLGDITQASRAAAVAAVDEQIRTRILSQLQSLRRNSIGSVDANLPVFPPQRVYYHDRRSWDRVRSESNDFVFCHNDLSPQNIFVRPDTFQIVAIIDWEFAGYFPSYFELPLWTVFESEEEQEIYQNSAARELGFFGLKTEDLEDSIPEQAGLSARQKESLGQDGGVKN